MVLDREMPSYPMLNAIGNNVEFCQQHALFLSVFHSDDSRGHEVSHKSSNFMPERTQGHKNRAQSLFLQSYGLTHY